MTYVVASALRMVALVVAGVACTLAVSAEDQRLSFGVVSQRSPMVTAKYWNPILRYVSHRSGVPLILKLSNTGEEASQAIGRGEPDFAYTNHCFSQENDRIGYRVIARPRENAVRGQIVVRSGSTIGSLHELNGVEVAFPHARAFLGYYVTQDHLLRAGIHVRPVFAGNQEGAMAQLKNGRVQAASVNSAVMREYAAREGLGYRALWSSEPFLAIPVVVHPRVGAERARAVQEALTTMADDPEGGRILAESAAQVGQVPPYGFVAASGSEYDNVRRVYRSRVVTGK